MPQRFLITGASRGIGLEFTRRLLDRGDEVVAAVRDPEGSKGLKALARPSLRLVPLDVADAKSIEGLGSRLGQTPIDVLINNAGVSSESKTLAVLDAAEMARVFMVNSIAPMLVVKSVIGQLRAGRSKTIVQITSVLASIERNTGGSTYAYRASKTALNQLNRSLAHELKPEGFTCVAVHPGWVRTDMGGPKADLSVEESVDHMLRTIGSLSPARSGEYLNYDGAKLPW
jgi:NAD(P)-dependent dehydrogenase (short-subunit alcohol dehydrogenase family)